MNATLTTTRTEDAWKIEAEGAAGYILFGVERETFFDEDGCEEDGEAYILIGHLHVDHASRGQGLGRQLLRAALATVADMGMRVKLNAEAQDHDTDEEMLVAFYESEGFWISDTESGLVFMER